MFNKVPINVSDECKINIENLYEVDFKLYEIHKENYIRQKVSKEKYSWDIL